MSGNNLETIFAKNIFIKTCGFSILTWISFVLSFISVPIIIRLFVPEKLKNKLNLQKP